MVKRLPYTLLMIAVAMNCLTGYARPLHEEETTRADLLSHAHSDHYSEITEGISVMETSPETAIRLFETAKQHGHPNADFMIGFVYDWILTDNNTDYAQAKACYEASPDNPFATLCLAYIYKDGKGVDRDPEKAQALFETAVSQIDENSIEDLSYARAAMYLLGTIYKDGCGVERDYNKARQWYTEAADHGSGLAMINIAHFYENGHGVERSYQRATEWYERAADAGDTRAMNEIGFLYEKGYGVTQSYTEARKWYEKSMVLGSTDAIVNVGRLYFYGYGVNQDYGKALELYERAAYAGNTKAMNNIGYMYEKGVGVEQDYNKALEWYNLSGQHISPIGR